MKTEIDPIKESEYMSWNKKQLVQGIQNRDKKINELSEKLQAMRDDDFKLIESLQKQIDEATKEYQTLYNNYAEHDRKLNEAETTIKELRLKLSEWIVED